MSSTIQVVAVKTDNNRGSEPWAGFYGTKALNQRRIKLGEKFTINDTPNDEKEKAKRAEKIKLKIVKFSNEKDEKAYIQYRDFGTWMTLNLSYKVSEPKRAIPVAPGTPDEGPEMEGEALGDEPAGGKDRSGEDTVEPAPMTAANVPDLPKPETTKTKGPKRTRN